MHHQLPLEVEQTQDQPLDFNVLQLKHNALQYADFEEAQAEAIPWHSRRGLTRESIMTHS
jgi:hypothetical protein